ncbi:MAG: chemotaxis protein CheW [FCB group bacterium]|jgi:purine-binding chemotaxis protein CheW|nr:chemotaxis protein CheW [FCB group bacterium]
MNATHTALAGKYLTFQLGDEHYGVEILKVQEIMGMLPITHVPRAPEAARGVINLRGRIIPVTGLRARFGLESQDDTERTCIVVVQVADTERPLTTGLLVDEVSEVVDIKADQIESAPELGSGADTAFLLGLGKVGQKVIMLLDVDRLFAHEELALAADASDAVETA